MSLSVSVSVAEFTVSRLPTLTPSLLPDTVMLSSPSTNVSSSGSSLNVPVALVWPELILIEKNDTRSGSNSE